MTRALLGSLAAAAALVAVYVALGGGGYDVDRPPDPCEPSPPATQEGLLGVAERVGIHALNGAACELDVSRERLMLVLAGEVEPPPGMTEERRTEAFRTGLRDAIAAEERAGRLSSTEAAILRGAVDIAPVETVLERLFGGT